MILRHKDENKMIRRQARTSTTRWWSSSDEKKKGSDVFYKVSECHARVFATFSSTTIHRHGDCSINPLKQKQREWEVRGSIEGSRILQRYMRDTANQRYLTDRNRAICAEQNTTLIDPWRDNLGQVVSTRTFPTADIVSVEAAECPNHQICCWNGKLRCHWSRSYPCPC